MLVVITIPLAITLLFQSPTVQTITAKLVTSMLSKSINQKVEINTIRLSFFSGINISEFTVEDHHENTLLGIGNLTAKPIFSNFSFSNIKFASVKLDSVIFNMGTYKNDSINNLSFLLHKFTDKSDTTKGAMFKLTSRVVQINNSQFNLFDQNSDYDTGENSMDYANILIDSINMDVNHFTIINDSLNFNIASLTANEQCGIKIKEMRCDIIISSNGIYTNNTLLNLNNSQLDVDFGMEYSSYGTFSHYIDSVNMIATVRPSTLDMADIGYFADIMFEMPNTIGLTGNLSGTVSNMNGKNIKVKFLNNTRVSGDFRFTGLPDFYNTNMIGNDIYMTTNVNDINHFNLPIEEKHLDFSNIVPSNEQITAKGNFKGYFKDFASKLDIISSYGTVNTDIVFKQVNDEKTDFEITAIGDSIDVGGLLNQTNILGRTSFNLKLTGHGKSTDSIRYGVSGKLENVNLLGYNYRRMSIVGSYFNDSIISELRVGDKNLMMTASATANLKSTPVFTLNSNIARSNLSNLKVFERKDIRLSTQITAKILGTNIDKLDLDFRLKNSKVSFGDSKYTIDSVVLSKRNDSAGITNILLNSDIISASIKGEYELTTVTQSFFNLINNYFNVMPVGDNIDSEANKYANIDVVFNKTNLISEQFTSGVLISENTHLHSEFGFEKKSIDLTMLSNKVTHGSTTLDSCSFNINSISDSLICEFAIKDIILKDSTSNDTLVFGMDNFSLSANVHTDSIIFGINWDNRNNYLKNLGKIEGYLSYTNDTTMFSIGKADVYINNILWNIDSNNLIAKAGDRVYFRDFIINAGGSEFKLFGTLPKIDNDSLVAEFINWDLSTFDIITAPMNFDLDGEINGTLNLSLIEKNPTLVSDIRIKDLKLNSQYLGDAHLLNSWDNTTNSIYIKSQIIRQGNAGKGEVFSADGYYYPFKKEDNLHIDIGFNRIKLKIIEPFVNNFVTDLEGTTSGQFKVRGSILQPIVVGSANMKRTAMRIVYLNTKYSFSNSIEFEENKIKFDKLVIYDTLGNQANIVGNLTHNYFKNPQFNILVSTSGLLFFNTKEYMNELYYGSAIAAGKIKISGSPNDIDLQINIETKKGTSVTLPLSYSVEISDKDYIIFVKPTIDSISEKLFIENNELEKEKDKLEYNIDVNMSVNPTALVSISLPNDMGTIEARGNSNLNIEANSNGLFSLVGDYTVDNGIFHFKIGNLVSKRFTLVKGGRISWTGSPYSANVSIKGLYKVKTSLASLGITIDSTATYKNRVTVECYVVLTNELLNPNIKFEIKIPELDPDLQRLVFSELDTTNTAIMNQQMISLLVLGTFSFNNASNVSLQSSYYNVIANQLSSMLSQISDNVDIGLNYKPGDNVSQEEFEVALSTQLFNDRLTIDGNFGMTYNRSEQSASNIVGDVDIGYKLTQDGQWILKVFNHSNVNSWYNYNNYDQISPYTQGVGIAFVKNFNNISELFSSKKKKKRKKKENKNNNELKKPDDETVE